MFSLRSAAADSAWMPMSNVPPSPAHAQHGRLGVALDVERRADAAEAAAAAEANGVCMNGTPAALYGDGPSITDQQHAGIDEHGVRPERLAGPCAWPAPRRTPRTPRCPATMISSCGR